MKSALKTCTKCRLVKPKSDYYKDMSECKTCNNYRRTALTRAKSIAAGKKQRTMTLDMKALLAHGLKRCPRCKEEKLLEEFHRSSSPKHAGGRATHCKICAAAMQEKYPYKPEKYQRNKEKVRDYKLRRAFGISLERYREMEAEQGGVCAVCGQREVGKALAVDHDHVTKVVRALLCGRCNPAIGFMRTAEIGKKLVAYLERHEKKG